MLQPRGTVAFHEDRSLTVAARMDAPHIQASQNPIASRDRQGAVAPTQLRLLEKSHSIPLSADHILDGRRHVLRLFQPSCAAMTRPSLPAHWIQVHPIQASAGVCLEVAHDALRRHLRFYHRVHMSTSHMSCQ